MALNGHVFVVMYRSEDEGPRPVAVFTRKHEAERWAAEQAAEAGKLYTFMLQEELAELFHVEEVELNPGIE